MIAGTVAESTENYDGMSYIEKLDAMTAAHGISKVKNAPVDENEVIRIANEHGVDLGVDMELLERKGPKNNPQWIVR